MNMFADAKLAEGVKILNGCHTLQSDLDKISESSNFWQIYFNVNNCHVMKSGIGEKQALHNLQIMLKDIKELGQNGLKVVLDSKFTRGPHQRQCKTSHLQNSKLILYIVVRRITKEIIHNIDETEIGVCSNCMVLLSNIKHINKI